MKSFDIKYRDKGTEIGGDVDKSYTCRLQVLYLSKRPRSRHSDKTRFS